MSTSTLEVAVVAVQSIVTQTDDLLGEALAEHRLTGVTAQALWAIDPSEAPPSMKAMAERLFCNAPNLTFVVNQLVERGFVERTVDPSDRRSRRVSLTDEGRRVRAAVIEAALATSPLARLAPKDLDRLVAILRKALPAPGDPEGDEVGHL
ncbi:MarR family winged helix-turn-helix transcriptional regulator [Amycolatopsis sp. GM8]|uniref:MarR family winged helix-turn-helix transcriptional regulator n=1 Tax=Amycolatopsis sp. GM8 TaxID=2896530 RepID=UPI001F00DE12|nr:MarR family transcriptional regulator [Amycolatopsis sp. GM8]